MVRQSCLRDRTVPVIADTSVVINLNASKCAETILDALPNPFLVVSEVVLELESGLQTGRNDAAALKEWHTSGRVQIVPLGDTGTRHFFNLVSGPPLKHLMTGKLQPSPMHWKRNPLPSPSWTNARQTASVPTVSLTL